MSPERDRRSEMPDPAAPRPAPGAPTHRLLRLQVTAGNAATNGMIRRDLDEGALNTFRMDAGLRDAKLVGGSSMGKLQQAMADYVVRQKTLDLKARTAKLNELDRMIRKWIADHATDPRRAPVEVVWTEVEQELKSLTAPAPAAPTTAAPTSWTGKAAPSTPVLKNEKAPAKAEPAKPAVAAPMLPAPPADLGAMLDDLIASGTPGAKPAAPEAAKATAAKLPKYVHTKKVDNHYAAEYTKGSGILAQMVEVCNKLCENTAMWLSFATHPDNLGLTNEAAAKYDTKEQRFQAFWEAFGWTVPEVMANFAKLDKLASDPPPKEEPDILAAAGDDADESKILVEKVDPKDVGRFQLNFGSTITRGADTAPWDTADHFSKFSGKGFAIFVMDAGGSFFSESHKVGKFHHSSFLPGVPVAGAGEISIKAGKVAKLTSKSGHYKPTVVQTLQVMKELDDNGVNLGGVDFTNKWADGVTPVGTFNAGKFFEEHRGKLIDPTIDPG